MADISKATGYAVLTVHGGVSKALAYAVLGPIPPPAPTSVDPSSGPPAGGTAVTIAGSGFAAGATVTFDGVSATSVVVVGDTQITCITPAHAVGAVDVVVTSLAGLPGTLTGGYAYVSPIVAAGLTGLSGLSGQSPMGQPPPDCSFFGL